MKQAVYKVLVFLHRVTRMIGGVMRRLFPRLAKHWEALSIAAAEGKITRVSHNRNGEQLPFVFYTPNALSKLRADTFSTKEPETLRWIDEHAAENGVFADIGANVGLYSLYHAKTKGGTTYAFEPSVFNLKLLVKNININKCEDKIRIISNPLSYSNSFAGFNLQSTEEAGALSSFGVDYGHDGEKLRTTISYQTLGFSLDYLVDSGFVNAPALIKIDVDGIEHLILRGAKRVLKNPQCRSVLIEVNDKFTAMADEVNAIMQESGFILTEKVADAAVVKTGNFTYNQIWLKQG